MPYQISRLCCGFGFLLILLALLGGCASKPPIEPFIPPVYPGPPDEPRFVYERTLRFNDNVEKLTGTDKFKAFVTGMREVKGLVKPMDVAVHQGRVYVTDTVQRMVVLFDIVGQRYKEIGISKPGNLVKPIAVDVSEATGEIFVTDVTARRIAVYSLEGEFRRYIGNKDTLLRPTGIAVHPEGKRVYVVDTGGIESSEHRVQIFDAATGDHIRTVGKRGNKEGEFNLPIMATATDEGDLLIVDKGNFRIQRFDSEGNFVSTFGKVGRYPGQFFSPKGIASDNEGNIYVVDTSFGNFQIFNAEGQLLMFIGDRGQSGKPGVYMLPAGIDVDQDGRIYIADQFFRKIDVFRPYALTENDGYTAQRD